MAAGGSSRMGQPKQLLAWQDSTLIETVVTTALELANTDVHVVLGAHNDLITEHLKSYQVELYYNPSWAEGLGNSISFGVSQIQAQDYTAVLILLADQPFISSFDLKKLIDHYKGTNKKIIGTSYPQGKVGVPALFDNYYFDQLIKLKGDKGASKLIHKHLEDVETIELNQGIIDIDTVEDYNKFKN